MVTSGLTQTGRGTTPQNTINSNGECAAPHVARAGPAQRHSGRRARRAHWLDGLLASGAVTVHCRALPGGRTAVPPRFSGGRRRLSPAAATGLSNVADCYHHVPTPQVCGGSAQALRLIRCGGAFDLSTVHEEDCVVARAPRGGVR
jgi:hypothetical protein